MHDILRNTDIEKDLEKLEDMVGVPFDIISTGPERSSTIVRKNPFLTRG